MFYRTSSKYEMKVEKEFVKFEVGVSILQNIENLYLVKFSRASGE